MTRSKGMMIHGLMYLWFAIVFSAAFLLSSCAPENNSGRAKRTTLVKFSSECELPQESDCDCLGKKLPDLKIEKKDNGWPCYLDSHCKSNHCSVIGSRLGGRCADECEPGDWCDDGYICHQTMDIDVSDYSENRWSCLPNMGDSCEDMDEWLYSTFIFDPCQPEDFCPINYMVFCSEYNTLHAMPLTKKQ